MSNKNTDHQFSRHKINSEKIHEIMEIPKKTSFVHQRTYLIPNANKKKMILD